MSVPSSKTQLLSLSSSLIELFSITYKGTTLNVCGSEMVGSVAVYGGITYSVAPVLMTGVEIAADGTLPRPSISLGNTTRLIATTFGKTDIVGAKVTRITTLAEFLDGEPGANSGNYISRSWFVDQKTGETGDIIAYALASPLEVMGKKLPKQQVTRNVFPGTARYV